MSANNTNIVFDYRALRLLMGLIAFSLPFVVSFISSVSLPSISFSYHTEARDAFVGMLFVVGAFLWAYNGHSLQEGVASKVASLAAVFVAIFPTSNNLCESDITSKIHFFAAVVLFSILAYFCFAPFRKNTKGQGGKKGRRSKVYFSCGCIMIICMLSVAIEKLTLPCETIKTLNITYWAEAIALVAFGVAWIVAGKIISPLVDKDEALRLFRNKVN